MKPYFFLNEKQLLKISKEKENDGIIKKYLVKKGNIANTIYTK